jgi:hypothetical protein
MSSHDFELAFQSGIGIPAGPNVEDARIDDPFVLRGGSGRISALPEGGDGTDGIGLGRPVLRPLLSSRTVLPAIMPRAETRLAASRPTREACGS